MNIDPKKMQAAMKQMGIQQKEIDASRVIIEKTNKDKIIIDQPSVVQIKMQGQEIFQISGEIIEEETESGFSDSDIETVMEKTGCSRKDAEKALEKTGDLAEAILELSK